jgi:propionyl-CoA carboxylase alpha chain
VFSKILIANRGEIACRVIKTARRMGIATVAVYSDADRDALHVEMADEAVRLGPAPSSESYLVIDAIIDACKQTGAEAVHPGYGFVSENAQFAQRLSDEGLTFIGPGTHAITSMGDKITSKNIAEEAGVNVIPGFTDVIKDSDHAVAIAREIGYPVMLKASAGGGGKGMRVVRGDDECRDGFDRASSEAQSSFGDARVFAEKFIEEPRHIEIQVLADQHGNTVYLGERECSIQRRHQKVIEEAPSPFLDPETRAAMGEQAVALARAVDYQSAGTVEFIVDADKNFYFLEMNTRLQVEHPVTEIVTGLDLVELMIRVAAGEALPVGQDDIRLRGWAVEARVYAEDPFRNFMPSIGRLIRYQEPPASDHIRVDSGVTEGGEVSMYYDPMIAKLIAAGDDRDQAIERLADALDQYYIRGVSHNISFLNAVAAHPRFKAGALSTHFIDEEYADGFSADDLPEGTPELFVVAASVIHRCHLDRAARLTGQLPKRERRIEPDWVVMMNGQPNDVTVVPVERGYEVVYRDTVYRVISDWRVGAPLFNAEINGHLASFQVDHRDAHYRLFHRGVEVDTLVLRPRGAALVALMPEKAPPDLSKYLLSPMPGLLVSVNGAAGDHVKAGEELAVVEAMKMENSLRAPQDVTIAKVLADPGESLQVDQPILEFE